MQKTITLSQSDPELEQIMQRFIGEEVAGRHTRLDAETQQLISIVSLVTQQSEKLLRRQVAEALSNGVTPVEIREAVYHCTPYIGFPRTVDAVKTMNEVFAENEIALPLEDQGTVDDTTRFSKGLDAQTTIFGDGMRRAAAAGAEQMPRSSYYLVTNCFGDYYTRNGLDLKTREILTLCILVNLGTVSQIRSHINGNIAMGRDKEYLSDAMYQCLPYTGYPRLLNAMACLNELMPDDAAADNFALAGGTATAAKDSEAAESNTRTTLDHVFPVGAENPFGEFFTGRTYLAPLVANEEVFNSPGMNHVTFEPAARTDWHTHDGGQILLVTGGVGYYQEEGGSIQILRPGDVVMIEPGVKHWHGAAPDEWFSHIAVGTNPEHPSANWMEKVTDEQYTDLETVEFAERN